MHHCGPDHKNVLQARMLVVWTTLTSSSPAHGCSGSAHADLGQLRNIAHGLWLTRKLHIKSALGQFRNLGLDHDSQQRVVTSNQIMRLNNISITWA